MDQCGSHFSTHGFRTSETSEPACEGDPATTYRGDPQPPVNERLEAARIFLADEDGDRYLHFARRLDEIAEYVEHIEKHEVEHDPQLLKDVKLKIVVHQEWQASRDAPLPSGCGCPTKMLRRPGVSKRLVSREALTKIENAKLAAGVEEQTRPDYPPFTTVRQRDDIQFRQAMAKSAKGNLPDVSQHRNICFVEGHAYADALEDPASIPHLLHPAQGLAYTGRKAGEDQPAPLIRRRELTEVEKHRPPRPPLPDYLKAAENEIDRLLRKTPLSGEECKRLECLLRLYEPDFVRKLFRDWQEALRRNKYERSEETLLGEKVYFEARDTWLDTFKSTGVYLILDDGTDQSAQPGVFYLPDPGSIPHERHFKARIDQERLDSLLSELRSRQREYSCDEEFHLDHTDLRAGSFFNLGNDRADTLIKRDLARILLPFAPESIRGKKSVKDTEAFVKSDVLDVSYNDWGTWVDIQVDLEPRIVLLRPGELQSTDSSLLEIVWEPEHNLQTIPYPPRDTDSGYSFEFQALIQKNSDPSYSLTDEENDRLVELISQIPDQRTRNPDFVCEILGVLPSRRHSQAGLSAMIDGIQGDNPIPQLDEADKLIEEYKARHAALMSQIDQPSVGARTTSAIGHDSHTKEAVSKALQSSKEEFLKIWWNWFLTLKVCSTTSLELLNNTDFEAKYWCDRAKGQSSGPEGCSRG